MHKPGEAFDQDMVDPVAAATYQRGSPPSFLGNLGPFHSTQLGCLGVLFDKDMVDLVAVPN